MGKYLDYLLSFILSIIVIFLGLSWFNRFQAKYPHTTLQLLGKLDYIDNKKLTILLESILKHNLWSIDVNKVKSIIYADPWVESVFIEKQWPDLLSIKIFQHNPISTWNDKFFLTSAGKVLPSIHENNFKLKFLHLPNFYGKSGQEDLMIRTYLLLLEKLSPLGLFVIKLDASEEQGITAFLSNGVKLKLGTFDFPNRIYRFVLAYRKKLQPSIGDIAYIDLRYNNGIAVYWENNSKL